MDLDGFNSLATILYVISLPMTMCGIVNASTFGGHSPQYGLLSRWGGGGVLAPSLGTHCEIDPKSGGGERAVKAETEEW